MTDGERLLSGILAEPGDDALRLVYADWLEEQGQQERAAFLRACTRRSKTAHIHQDADYRRSCERCRLDGTVAFLWTEWHDGDWRGRGPQPPWWPKKDGWYCSIWGRPGRDGIARDMGCDVWLGIDKGLIDYVRCPLQSWLQHGKAICAAHPVEACEASDKKPHAALGLFAWWRERWSASHDPSDLPDELFGLLRGGEPKASDVGLGFDWHDRHQWRTYATEQDANDALSRALIAWAHP